MRFPFSLPREKVWAVAIHVLTASGALCGLAALHYATLHDWPAAFAWLGLALVIDAVDGPLARRLRVHEVLPRFSGERLDLVVDYLNYCAVPAFMLWQSGLLPPIMAAVAAMLIALTSLFHFADRHSKTPDGFFVGFPALWNVVLFYLFAFGLTGPAAFLVVAALAIATVIPVKWAHPIRAERLRPVTLIVLAAWSVAGVAALLQGLPAPALTQAVLAAAALYMVGLGLWRSLASP